jgi:hypothetical protein
MLAAFPMPEDKWVLPRAGALCGSREARDSGIFRVFKTLVPLPKQRPSECCAATALVPAKANSLTHTNHGGSRFVFLASAAASFHSSRRLAGLVSPIGAVVRGPCLFLHPGTGRNPLRGSHDN